MTLLTDMRPVLFILGILVTALGVGMIVPALFELMTQGDEWQIFLETAVITIFAGSLLVATNFQSTLPKLNIRQAYLLTGASWLSLSVFAALPLAHSSLGLSTTDAFFEAVSGITTTGSTVVSGLDDLPRGILLWRSLLQWLGGIGIIAMAVALLPLMRVGGMQLFQTESSDRSEKVLPKTPQIAAYVLSLYVGFTCLCFVLLFITGLDVFDALNHAMTSVATGGYSTKDASVGHFDNPAAEIVIMVFMLIGAMTFTLYVRMALRGPGAFRRDSQVQTFLALVFSAIAVMTLWLVLANDMEIHQAARYAAFNLISIITTTGYATADYGAWGPFPVLFFFVAMFMGGCTGSTSGSIKTFRWQILYLLIRSQIRRMIHPHGVFVEMYQGRAVMAEIGHSVSTFLFFYAASFIVFAVLLSFTGLDMLTAASAAATAISNVGPGLGDIVGPAGNFATLSDPAKWLLSLAMLMGRLELITLILPLTPWFWRQW